MKRRNVLKVALAAPWLPLVWSRGIASAWATAPRATRWHSRVRPGEPGWPSAAQWQQLQHHVDGRLLKLESPFAGCATTQPTTTCDEALRQLRNPFYLGDQPALTQSSGWVDAWTSQPSVYAVVASNTADVVAAVNFARTHHLRLVVKGGGHSYQGTSDAPDSLLVWTRHMHQVSLHDAFVSQGCADTQAPQPAVSIGAGAMWIDAYAEVTTRAGRYVQGGGCTTVGVAGLVQSGGFGSFSKNFGSAAASLLEAEIVTADGQVRIANACTNPDLFWGLKGGGGGSLGVITRLTLRTHELPDTFGAVFGKVKATSALAFRKLLAHTLAFYQEHLFNPYWGEQIRFGADNTVEFSLVFQGLDTQQVRATWQPFLDWIASRQHDYSVEAPVQIFGLPARHFWDAEFLLKHAPGVAIADARAGAPKNHYFWAGDQAQTGQFVHGYKSAWLPASLLQHDQQARLVDAMFAATRHWGCSLHFNKGLGGAAADTIAAARDTATHPGMLDAFALAIMGAEGPPAFAGMPRARPDLVAARKDAAGIGRAMAALLKVAPEAGSYVAESDYFEPAWQAAFWGTNYTRLAAVKRKYDPDGLFFVHHGVGSEMWSADGFTRLHGG